MNRHHGLALRASHDEMRAPLTNFDASKPPKYAPNLSRRHFSLLNYTAICLIQLDALSRPCMFVFSAAVLKRPVSVPRRGGDFVGYFLVKRKATAHPYGVEAGEEERVAKPKMDHGRPARRETRLMAAEWHTAPSA